MFQNNLHFSHLGQVFKEITVKHCDILNCDPRITQVLGHLIYFISRFCLFIAYEAMKKPISALYHVILNTLDRFPGTNQFRILIQLVYKGKHSISDLANCSFKDYVFKLETFF